MAIKITPEGKIVPDIEPQNGTDFSLEELYQHVGCSCVQMITLYDDRIMWIDEEGKMKDKPINTMATGMFYASGGVVGDYIVGTVFVCDNSQVK